MTNNDKSNHDSQSITDLFHRVERLIPKHEKLVTIRPDMPAIICTGFSERIDEETASEMGVSALIMKPVDTKELATKVREVLDKQM